MATNWNDVVKHLTKHYKCEQATADLVRMVFSFETRSQLVLVARGTGGQGDWIHIQSPIGEPPVNKLTPLLEECGSKLCGALVMMSGCVFLRHSIPVTSFKPDEFDWALKAVMATADNMEERFVGGDKY